MEKSKVSPLTLLGNNKIAILIWGKPLFYRKKYREKQGNNQEMEKWESKGENLI